MKSQIEALIVYTQAWCLPSLEGRLAPSGIHAPKGPVRMEEALPRLGSKRTDVLILNVETGQEEACEEFIKNLMADANRRLPILVLCMDFRISRRMMRAGAVDALLIPQELVDQEEAQLDAEVLRKFIRELALKSKLASAARLKQLVEEGGSPSVVPLRRSAAPAPPVKAAPIPQKLPAAASKGIIAIGASTGGTEAIFSILKDLPTTVPGIVIVQHMPPGFTRMYAQRLNQDCAITVKEAEGGEVLEPGLALVAPGDKHMKVVKRDGQYIAKVQEGPRVNGHCPSVEVLFNSVAECAGPDAVGIILTGMGRDGARGLKNMRDNGAYTIGQDEETSVVYGMPKVAFDEGAVVRQAPLGEIASLLMMHLAKKQK